MKSLHFCTPNMLNLIKNCKVGSIIKTIRTGFVPNIYEGDIILLKERRDNKSKDIILGKGKVLGVYPYTYMRLKEKYKLKEGNWTFDKYANCIIEEIKKYKRKFNPWHYFFEITIKVIKKERIQDEVNI
ncbi:MAG: hypothetical protein ACP6IY_10655 [Promethearchaeia archaeon]